MGKRRVILMILDSVGIGKAKDAAIFGDTGSDTLKSALTSDSSLMPNMGKLGLFNIDDMEWAVPEKRPKGSYARLSEASMGKDTTTGHWEIAGIVSQKPMPTFPKGFPQPLIDRISEATGRGILCNMPYSGTNVIRDYGPQHLKSGDLIIYTSADSVLQVAAHEEVICIEELYEICRKIREICTGEYAVGRVIARPFIGTFPDYERTSGRHDFSLEPPKETVLDMICAQGLKVYAVGKINDIFAGCGISEFVRTSSNMDGVDKTIEYMKRDEGGLIFTNLVDFDMLYGHRNNVEGYKKALIDFDNRLPEILGAMKEDDVLMITADHGCDPSTPSTDHSRENTFWLIYGENIKEGVNLGTGETFADIGATILEYLGVYGKTDGTSFFEDLVTDGFVTKRVDHTNLNVTAGSADIEKLCAEARRYKAASVCVAPYYVKKAKELLKDDVKVCTVIGFPNGYNKTSIKCAEAEAAIEDGADEIDMVINQGMVKDGLFFSIGDEIATVKKVCKDHVLKVIIETCLLTQEETVKLCEVVSDAGADFIKTSTGFSKSGANIETVRLMRRSSPAGLGIKAAGGIKSIWDAKALLAAGADRLGTSSIIGKLIENGEEGQDKALSENMKLMDAAKEARKKAYAPYSHYTVGAALLCNDGRVFKGCNVENAAFSPGTCAERTAVIKAVSEGAYGFKAIAIAGGRLGEEIGTTAPCGVCRQVLSEFCGPEMDIIMQYGDGIRVVKLGQLLPENFKLF